MIYNTKILEFANGKKLVKFYAKPIHVNDSVTERVQEKKQITEELKRMYDNFDSSDRSKDLSLSRTVQNIYNISRSNVWDYFVTFTFNPKRVDREDYDDCLVSVKKIIDYYRKFYCPDIKYLLVPEYHKDGKSIHFHGLFANCGELPLVIATGKDGNPLIDVKGRYIYNAPDYIYGFSTLTKVFDNFAVCSYMTKYITKELMLDTYGRNRYICSHNACRPVQKVAILTQSQLDALLVSNKLTFTKTIGEDETKVSIFEVDDNKEFYNGFEDIFYDFEDLNMD